MQAKTVEMCLDRLLGRSRQSSHRCPLLRRADANARLI
jgi:hypothetical protein